MSRIGPILIFWTWGKKSILAIILKLFKHVRVYKGEQFIASQVCYNNFKNMANIKILDMGGHSLYGHLYTTKKTTWKPKLSILLHSTCQELI